MEGLRVARKRYGRFLLTMLLAMVMTVLFMPASAFADDGQDWNFDIHPQVVYCDTNTLGDDTGSGGLLSSGWALPADLDSQTERHALIDQLQLVANPDRDDREGVRYTYEWNIDESLLKENGCNNREDGEVDENDDLGRAFLSVIEHYDSKDFIKSLDEQEDGSALVKIKSMEEVYNSTAERLNNDYAAWFEEIQRDDPELAAHLTETYGEDVSIRMGMLKDAVREGFNLRINVTVRKMVGGETVCERSDCISIGVCDELVEIRPTEENMIDRIEAGDSETIRPEFWFFRDTYFFDGEGDKAVTQGRQNAAEFKWIECSRDDANRVIEDAENAALNSIVDDVKDGNLPDIKDEIEGGYRYDTDGDFDWDNPDIDYLRNHLSRSVIRDYTFDEIGALVSSDSADGTSADSENGVFTITKDSDENGECYTITRNNNNCADITVFSKADVWTHGLVFQTYHILGMEYEMNGHRDLLPGWDDWVGGRSRLHFYRADGDDWDEEYEITNVEIINEEPEEEGKKVVELEEPNEDGNWRIEAKNYGTATVEVSYLKQNGSEGSYQYDLDVVRDVYGMDLYTHQGTDQTIAGGSISVGQTSWHKQKNDPEGRDSVKDVNAEGLKVYWAIAEGNDFVATTGMNNDSCIVTFTDMPEDQNQMHVRLEALLYDPDDNDKDSRPEHVLAYRDYWLHAYNEYDELWFKDSNDHYSATINNKMEVGDVEQYTVEMRYYKAGEEEPYTLEEGAEFNWYYDRNALEVNSNGNQLTIERYGDWDTNIDVEVCVPGWDDSWRRDYHLDGRNYELWLDDGGNNRFYTDSATKTIYLDEDENNTLDPTVTVGFWGDEEWDKEFTKGTHYTYEDGVITLNRDAILNELGEINSEDRSICNVRIYAEMSNNGRKLRDKDCWIELKQAGPMYDREENRDMLPGWDGDVDNWSRGSYEDSEHTDGYGFDYRITNVRLLDEDEHGNKFLTEEDFEDFNLDFDGDEFRHLHYKTGDKFGTARFEVTYLCYDPDENAEPVTDTYTFDVNVTDHVYGVDMNCVNGEYFSLPGGSIDLYSDASHEYIDDQGDYHNDTEGLRYDWVIDGGKDFAEISGDGDSAILTFNAMPEGWDWIDEKVWVRVKVYDGIREVATASKEFRVCKDFCQIEPMTLSGSIAGDLYTDAGVSYPDRKFCVKRYWLNDEGETCNEVVEGVKYEWHYGENAISITEPVEDEENPGTFVNKEVGDGETAAGDTFTIRRLNGGNQGFNVKAYWEDENDNYQERWNNYYFRHMDYDIWFEGDDFEYYTDSSDPAAVVLNLDSLNEDWEEKFDLDIAAGIWNDDNDEWEVEYKEGEDYIVSINGGGEDGEGNYVPRTATITLKDSLIKKINDSDDDETGIRITAELYPHGMDKNDDTRLCDRNAWLRIRKAERDYHYGDRDELPGYMDGIDGHRDFHVRNSRYPEGNDFEYDVTDVEVTDGAWLLNNDLDNREDGDFLYKDDEDNRWYYDTKSARQLDEEDLDYGDISFKVYYELTDQDDGDEQAEPGTGYFEFTVHLCHDLYDLWVVNETAGDTYTGLPGDEFQLRADSNHRFINKDFEEDDNKDNLEYRWELEGNGSEYASIVPDPEAPEDTSRAILKFKEAGDGENDTILIDERGLDRNVGVRVYLYDTTSEPASDDNFVETTRRDFHITDEYDEMWLSADYDADGDEWSNWTTAFPDLEPGESATVKLELRKYAMRFNDPEHGTNYVAIEDPEYTWHLFADYDIEIKDSNGDVMNESPDGDREYVLDPSHDDVYTITRREGANWDIDFDVYAEYLGSSGDGKPEYGGRSGNDRFECGYHLDNRNYDDYRIWFDDQGSDIVYTDGNKEISVNTDRLRDDWRDKFDIVFTVGEGNYVKVGEGDEEHYELSWDKQLNENTHYTVDSDKPSVTIIGPAMTEYADKDSNLLIVAEVRLKGTDIKYYEQDYHFNVSYVWEENDFPGSYDGSNSETILRGWEVPVDEYIGYWGGNGATGDYNGNFNVTKVEFSDDTVDVHATDDGITDGKTVIVKQEEDGHTSWHIWGAAEGESKISVTFTDPDGKSVNKLLDDGSPYEFTVHVVNDIYEATIDSVDGLFIVDPGESIHLKTYAVHKYTRDNDEGGWDYGEDHEGLTFEWELDNNEIATITADPDHPDDTSRAVLTFKTDEDLDGYRDGTRVTVKVKKDGEEVTSTFDYYAVQDEYQRIKPSRIVSDMAVGKSRELNMRVMLYENGKSVGTIPGDIEYNWSYDEDVVRIEEITEDNEGNRVYKPINNWEPTNADRIRITRLTSDYTRIVLRAQWGMGQFVWHAYYLDPVDEENPSGYEPEFYAMDADGRKFYDGDPLYLDPDEEVFVTFTAGSYDEFEENDLDPRIGFYDNIDDGNGNMTGDLSDLGFDIEGDEVDGHFGIWIRAGEMNVGDVGTLRYFAYPAGAETPWASFDPAYTHTLKVNVAETISFNNDGDDKPLYKNSTKSYPITFKDGSAAADLGDIEFYAGAIGDEGFKPFIELNPDNNYSSDYGSYDAKTGKLTLSGAGICNDTENFNTLTEVAKGRNLHVRAWVRNSKGNIVAIGHCNCLVRNNDCSHTGQTGESLLVKTNRVDPTCTVDGTEAYWTCSECGLMFSNENGEHQIDAPVAIPASHNWEFENFTWTANETSGYTAVANYKCKRDASHTQTVTATVTDQVTTAATCTADGVRTYTANVAAGDSLDGTAHSDTKDETLNKLNHNYSTDWTTNDTHHWHACQNSGCTEKDSYGEHVWELTTVTTAATCTETGTGTYTCKTCGATKTDTVPATGHAFADAWTTDDTHHWHACQNAGCTEKEAYGDHVWELTETVTAPTCTQTGTGTYTCSTCGKTKTDTVPATGHDFAEAWTTDDTHHWHACKNAGCTEKDSCAEHTWNGGVVTQAPTEDAEGVMTYTCTVCSKTRTESIGKLNHNYSADWTTDDTHHWHACQNAGCTEKDSYGEHVWELTATATAPTCTQTGTGTYTCTTCGATKTDTVPATGHDFAEAWTTDDTHHWHACQNAGCTEKDSYGEHVWELTTVTTAATCTETGTGTYTCKTCGATKTDTIPATGHNWEFVNFTWTGYTAVANYKCSRDAGHTQTVAATITNKVTKAATCESDGIRTYTATVTADKSLDGNTHSGTKDETLNKLGHKYDGGKVTKKATTTAAGKITYTCQNDKSHTKTETIAKMSFTAKATKQSYTLKVANLKKKAQTISKPVKVTLNPAVGYTFKKTSGKSNFTVNSSNGTVTVKKGTKKGTYTVKVKVTTKTNAKYETANKTVSLKIVVK